jgi:cysteinyl-tRNA synthetase
VGPPSGAPPSAIFDGVLASLSDDLNTPGALGALFTAINAFDARAATAADRAAFDRAMAVLGFNLPAGAPGAAAVPEAVDMLAKRRWDAKKAKDFATADALRGELASAGWSMLDGKDGYRLEPLKKA